MAQEKKSAKRKAVSTQQKSEASSSSAIPGPSRLTSNKGNTSQETAKMRKLLDEKLSTYKQKNLRKRLPAADSAETIEFKKKMMQQLEDSDGKFHESMQQMSSNLDKFSGAILSGFTLLKQTLQQSQGVPQHSTCQSFHAGAPLYPTAGYQFNSRYPILPHAVSPVNTDIGSVDKQTPRPDTSADIDLDNGDCGPYTF